MEHSLNQPTLSHKVATIKRQVRQTIGSQLSHDFRSSSVYQSYTGLCGEAEMALQDGNLDETLVTKLEEYAGKVIALWQEQGS
jgi:hypothetical protein